MTAFPHEAHSNFAAHYPEVPHLLPHCLGCHPLLELDAIAQLAEALPGNSVEYNLGDLPIGVETKPARPAAPVGEIIRNLGSSGSWVVLQRIEQVPEYASLVAHLLDELRPEIEATTGRILMVQGFMFASSPHSIAPFHFDPEHNILMQIQGSKVFTQFPAGDTRFASDEAHESFHARGEYTLAWHDELAAGGREFHLHPGEALYVPVKAPHFVRNGPEPSVSLSITWRSQWSFEEADARAFNSVLRRMGLRPASTGRWPARNLAKAYGWRVLRKLGA